MFDGTKSIVISTVSWMGGKQPFLGWSYVAVSAICVFLAIAGTLKHMIKPRKMGDMSSEFSLAQSVGILLKDISRQCSPGISPLVESLASFGCRFL